MAQTDVDIDAIIWQAKRLVADHGIAGTLTRTDVVKWANEILALPANSKKSLTYGKLRSLDKYAIIVPATRVRGEKTFHFYSEEDLAYIIAYKTLELRYGIPGRQAITQVSAQRLSSAQLLPSDEGVERSAQVSDRLTVTGGAARAQRYIWSRCLTYALTLLFGELLPGTILIVEHMKTINGEPPSSTLARVNKSVRQEGLVKTSRTTLAVRINRSSMSYIEPFLKITEEEPVPEEFMLYDSSEGIGYGLALYLPDKASLELTPDGENMLASPDSYQASLVFSLLGLSFRRFSTPYSQIEDLTAMADFVVQALPQIDFCAILLPQIEGPYRRDTLTVHAHSEYFPDELKSATVVSGDLVAGWVHQNLLPVFIEELERDDSRASDWERDFFAVAAAPLWALDSRGVLYAARFNNRGLLQDEGVTAPITQDLFSILAGIAGEMAYNELLFKVNTKNATKAISQGPLLIRDGGSIVNSLSTDFAETQKPTSVGDSNLYLSAIVTSIENFHEIVEECGAPVGTWLEQHVLETGRKLLSRKVDCRYDIYKLKPGQFVLLLQRCSVLEDEIKAVSIQLRDILRSIVLRTQTGSRSVEFLSWRIVYSYDRYTTRKLGALKNGRDLQNASLKLAKYIYERYVGAAETLGLNFRAHEAMARWAYSTAFNRFSEAARIDPDSAYYQKHQAEALFEDGNFETALGYCLGALNQDEDYAGGHYMKAEILASLGKFEKASDEYRKAIDISSRAKHFLLFGITLVANKQYKEAIHQFTEAKERDPRNRALYELLIARTLMLQGKPVEALKKLTDIPGENQGAEILIKYEKEIINASLRDNQSAVRGN